MTLPRGQFFHVVAGAAMLPAVPPIASAETYPSRPVRIIVGFTAGSTSDILARLMGHTSLQSSAWCQEPPIEATLKYDKSSVS
jgi:tripartite-type tricarboxylate transporter receptor subunit TctC